MIIRVLQYIRGYLLIRVSGHSAERFLNACSYRGIRLWDLTPSGDAYEMNITVRGFREIKPIVRKTGAKVLIVKRAGLPFFLHRYRRRKLFFVGACVCLMLIGILSRFIWNIDIRGNLTQTDETLLKFLEGQDVRDGMRISEVDCAGIVKDLRREYDDIIWASASIEGTRLVIQVKENQDGFEEPEKEEGAEAKPTDIVADRDCVITEIVTRRGIAQVQEGAQVHKGDLLVSGQIPVSNDAGEVVAYQYQEADADILGRAEEAYSDSQSLTYEAKEFLGIEKKEAYIRLGDFRLSLGGIQNQYEHFEQYSEERQLKIFENFYLPVAWGNRNARPYRVSAETYEKEELRRMLSARFFEYCGDLEKKGVEIVENDVKIYTGSKEAEAKGTLTLILPVGTAKASQMTEAGPQTEQNGQSGEEMNGNDGSGD